MRFNSWCCGWSIAKTWGSRRWLNKLAWKQTMEHIWSSSWYWKWGDSSELWWSDYNLLVWTAGYSRHDERRFVHTITTGSFGGEACQINPHAIRREIIHMSAGGIQISLNAARNLENTFSVSYLFERETKGMRELHSKAQHDITMPTIGTWNLSSYLSDMPQALETNVFWGYHRRCKLT